MPPTCGNHDPATRRFLKEVHDRLADVLTKTALPWPGVSVRGAEEDAYWQEAEKESQ